MYCVLEMEQTRLNPRGVSFETDSPSSWGLGKPLGPPSTLSSSDQGLGQLELGRRRPSHRWWLGAGYVAGLAVIRAQQRFSMAPDRTIPGAGAGCPGLRGGFLWSQPHPGGQGVGQPSTEDGPLLASSGVWRVLGGRLLRVVSAGAPERSYVNICAERSLGWEQSLTVALGSGRGSRGQQEASRGRETG